MTAREWVKNTPSLQKGAGYPQKKGKPSKKMDFTKKMAFNLKPKQPFFCLLKFS